MNINTDLVFRLLKGPSNTQAPSSEFQISLIISKVSKQVKNPDSEIKYTTG